MRHELIVTWEKYWFIGYFGTGVISVALAESHWGFICLMIVFAEIALWMMLTLVLPKPRKHRTRSRRVSTIAR